ncbi:MAG: hypothetical protein WBS20_06165 [Lysobacterales bacterium]
MDLQVLANIAEIIGTLLVISGVFFGLVEIRHYRQQRQETAAMEIMRTFQSRDFTGALRLIMDYEQECLRCREESIPLELQDAALLVSTTMEAIGLMVYQRLVPFQTVQLLMGGTTQASWRVLRPHTEWLREKLERPSIHEWFQWLSERLDEHPEYRDEEGAYLKYQDWQPEKDPGR